jgi:uncharacterized integral membrane protein
MRRFLTLFVLLPTAVIVVLLSVANRGEVAFSLDPIHGATGGWAVKAPLFAMLFVAAIFGIVIGGIAAWIGQGRWRHAARAERANADRLRSEVDQLRAQIAATTTALGAPRPNRDAA